MTARAARSATLLQLGLLLAGALVLGVLFGQPWPALAIAAITLLGWQVWRLQGLVVRLGARQRVLPAGRGLWGELDRLLDRGQRDMRARKRRLLGMLRAYRAAAAALPDAVVVVARDHQRILWFNEAATTLLGLRYPQDIDAALGERLQPLPVAHWLAAGRKAEPLLAGDGA